ncbi:MAG: ABC transporter permease [Candidatus Moranbacteria bacterium]|nr:ABC transporter permease [Candidatus Moranbacteria bacterium]
MNLSGPIKISYKNLMADKLRSFLTILGIVIGVAAVVVIMAIGSSAQSLIVKQVEGVGSNLIAVLPGSSNEQGPPAAAFGITVKTLSYEDLEALRNPRNIPEISAGAGYVNGNLAVSRQDKSKVLSITGTTASYPEVENALVEKGRFFDNEEETNLSRVAVLGSQAAKDYFGEDDPLNERIKINGQNYEIVGVMEERGVSAFGLSSQDDSIIIPLKTAQKLVLGVDYLNFIRLKAKDPELVSRGKSQVEDLMMSRHKIDDPEKKDFSVRDQASALETVKKVTDVVRYFLLTVGSVALLVGGIGIMNIMLISVNQRVREVGLRKAVGAKNKDILLQFLTESVTVSLIGGLLGVVLGVATAFLIAAAANQLGYDWSFLISGWAILTAFAVSFVAGILFGIYPARKASKISPMEALRYE